MLGSPLIFCVLLSASFDARVDRLGHDDWLAREAASAGLVDYYPLSAAALDAASASPDAEARKRALDCVSRAKSAEKVRFVAATLAALERATGYRGWPWIDSLPEGHYERSRIICDYLVWVRECVWPDQFSSPHWRDYRLATEHYCWMLHGSRPDAEILLLLRRMVDGDRRQWLKSAKTWEWLGAKE